MAGRGRGRTAGPRGWTWMAVGVALVAAGVALGAWWGALASRSGGTPRLVVDRTEVDLGYLRYGTRVRAAFTVSNTGDGPLVLREPPEVLLAKGC